MRYLLELGSPDSIYHTVFCCSHIVVAVFLFLVVDVTLTFWLFLFEGFITTYHDIQDQVWISFHAISLITIGSGLFALCDSPIATIVYGCRISLILAITIVRFIVSVRQFASRGTKEEAPTVQEFANLFQIVPIIAYTVGVFLVIRLFSYWTGRYRGYYDVDVELREEVKRKFAEYEADLNESAAVASSHKTD